MVDLVLTPKLKQALDAHSPDHGFTTHVPHSALKGLSDLSSLLQGTRIYRAPTPEPSAEEKEKKRAFRASMETLAQQLHERDYQALLQDGSLHRPLLSGGNLAESAEDLRNLRNQLSTIVNVGLSIMTAAMAAWFWLSSWSLPTRVLACLGSALGLGCIEVFLYLRYVTKVDQAKAYDKRLPSNSKVKVKQKKEQ